MTARLSHILLVSTGSRRKEFLSPFFLLRSFQFLFGTVRIPLLLALVGMPRLRLRCRLDFVALFARHTDCLTVAEEGIKMEMFIVPWSTAAANLS